MLHNTTLKQADFINVTFYKEYPVCAPLPSAFLFDPDDGD